MAKVNENAAVAELPLEDGRLPQKQNRHVVVALRHLEKRRAALVAQRGKLSQEIAGIDEAIKSLG